MGQLGIGTSQDTGNRGDSIPVKLLDGTVINTTAGNSISGGKVLVAVTDSGEAYSFANPTITEIGNRQITRCRPRKRSIVSFDYPFKVLAKGSVIMVQGFDDDVDVTTSGNLIGFTNTGEGYSAIIKNGDSYLFDVDGEQVTQALNNLQFIGGFVPGFSWYGGTDLLATQTKYSTESVHTFNPVVTSPNTYAYFANYVNVTINNRYIANFVGDFSNDIVSTETWTSTDPNDAVTNCKSNFTFDRLIAGTNNVEYIVDYYEKRNYSTVYYDLDKDGLTEQKVDFLDERLTTGSKSVIRNPPSENDYIVTTTTTESVTESNQVNHVAFTQSYAEAIHQTTKDYSRNRTHNLEQIDYTYNVLTVTYSYPYSWIITPREGSIYDPTPGTPYTFNSGVTGLSSTFTNGEPSPNWTIDFDTYYTNFGNNEFADVWVKRFTNPDGVMISPDYDPVASFYDCIADNYIYVFNGVTTDIAYPRATKPTVGTPIETGRAWNSYKTNGALTSSYNTDTSDETIDNYTTTSLIHQSDSVTIYNFTTKKYEKTITSFYEYEYIWNSTTNSNSTTAIRPSNIITDEKEDNPITSNLIVKLDESIYEITDFDEVNGFDFENRFLFISTTTIENLISGTYNLNTQQIGVNSNNKGNYTKILKRYQYNSVNNPDGTVTYHPIVPFTASGQNVEIYHIYNGVTKKYSGTITSLNGALQNSNGTYRKEEWYSWTSMTISINTSEILGFYHWSNIYDNAIIVVPQNNHLISLIKYIEQDKQRVNIYEINNTIQLSIAKKLTSDNLDGEEEWYADIYEFNTTQKRFERIGNESGSLSEINGSNYDFIQYHPI